MRLPLLESGRSFFQVAECACASLVVHAGIVWFALNATEGGMQLPADEREARVFFLLPPDRIDARARQTEVIQWGKLGSDLQDGKFLTKPKEGWLIRERAYGARRKGGETGAKGQLPFGPVSPFVLDTAFSVLEVDQTAERYENTAAPIYPRELLAIGLQGMVQATYVVDTSGLVDTTTVKVILSDDPRFTESVRTALGLMRFRPAKRAGKTVRQLCEQKFRFKIVPAPEIAKQLS